MSLLKPKQTEFYLAISEGNKGIEYFFDEDIKKLPYVIRRTIITFLTIAITELQTNQEQEDFNKK